MNKMNESKRTELLTVILGVCIALPRIIMPTYIAISTGVVWAEMLLEMFIAVAVIYLNRNSLKNLLSQKVKPGRFILNVLSVFLATRLGVVLLVTILSSVLVLFFNIQMRDFYDPAATIGQLFQATAAFPVMITQCLLAPVTEEIVFRKTVNDLIPNKFLYIIVSSVLFGFIHCAIFANLSVLTYVVFGMAFNIAYLVNKKDIRPLIVAHMIGNIIATITSLTSM